MMAREDLEDCLVERNFYYWRIANYRYNEFLCTGHTVKEDLWINMVSDNFSGNGPRVPVIGVVTPIMGEVNAARYVPPQA